MKYSFIKTDYLQMVSGGSREVVLELLEIFRNQASEFYLEMKSLNQAGRFNELGLLAHKAKSSVAIMGMEPLASRLKEMELSTREANHNHDYSETIETFRTETTGAIKELEHYSENI